MGKNDSLEFIKELKDKRSIKIATPRFEIDKKDQFSESCLGLCVE
jgi:hypothetical protein